MNWRLFGWLAALFGGAIIAIWLVFSLIGLVFGALAAFLKVALVVGFIGLVVFLGFKAKQAIGGSSNKQIRR